MSAHRAALLGVVVLATGLGSYGPACAQLAQPGVPSAMSSDPSNNPTAPSSGSSASIGIVDPSGLSFGVTPGGALLANPSDATNAGTSTGIADPSGLNLGVPTNSALSTGQRIGGVGCAPAGSAAAFANTAQPGLCLGSTGGGGAPGAGFSGGAAASRLDDLFDPIEGQGLR